MKNQPDVVQKDLQRLSAVVDRQHLDTTETGLPFSVLEAITALVPCDDACQLSPNPTRRRIVLDKGYLPGDGSTYLDEGDDSVPMTAEEERYWMLPFKSLCCNFPYWTGDYRSVHRATDWFESERDYVNSEIGSLIRADGRRFSMLIPLPSEGPVEHQVVMFRHRGRDFSDREQVLLSLLRPHLAELHMEQRRRRVSGGLTPRQIEILRLVSQGLTNRQIASRLNLSEGTVRTHMENIFERLCVTSRTAAVARVIELRPKAPA